MIKSLFHFLSMSNWNTKESGSLTFFSYFDKEEESFVTVCLEMDIVKVSMDHDESAKEAIEAVRHIIELVGKGELDEEVLNRNAPKQYWDLYEASQARRPSLIRRWMSSHAAPDTETTVRRIPSKDLLGSQMNSMMASCRVA